MLLVITVSDGTGHAWDSHSFYNIRNNVISMGRCQKYTGEGGIDLAAFGKDRIDLS